MDLALMIEGQEGVTWPQWKALAHAAEEHGLAGLFRSDHYVSVMGHEERGTLDAWATLNALAAVTSRIRLGTLVSPVTFRHPAELAKAVVTADHVSEGRIELGLGAGWHDREHAAWGFAYPDLGTRMELLTEQLEIISRLLTEDEVTFDGDHYHVDAVRPFPKPVQERLPLIVGGLAGPRSAALAARWADEYNTVFPSLDDVADRRVRLVEAYKEANRDPDELRLSMMTRCIVGADEDEVRTRVRADMERAGEEGDVDAYLEANADRWLVGTVDQVVERLRAFADAGVCRVMCQHVAHTDLDMVELLGRQVAPAVDEF